MGQNTKEIKVLWNNSSSPQTATIKLVIKKCNLTSPIYTRSVNIIPAPTIQIVSNSSFCSLQNASFLLSTNLINLPIGTLVSWTFSDGTTNSIPVSAANPNAQIIKTFNNNTEINIALTATASITNVSNCSGTITNVKSFTVTPGSKAALSFQYGNNFCQDPPTTVTTLFSASISNTASIQGWYLNGFVIPGQTATTLNVQSLGLSNPFGVYYFKTSYNGCFSNSNPIQISQQCVPVTACTISPNPVVTFNATNDCGKLILNGTASSGSLIIKKFVVIGPSANQIVIQTTNPQEVEIQIAGIYTLFYMAEYNSATGPSPCPVTLNAELTIPFVPDLKSAIVCNNNLFTIDITDNSSFMGSVINRTFQYKIGTSASGPWTILTSSGVNLQNATTNQPAGNYYVQMSIGGTFNGVTSTCTKVFILPQIAPIPTNQTIVFTQPNCYDKAVKFEVTNPQLGDTYLWTFEDNVTNTLASPERVFPASTTYPVSVQITNQYGCVRNLEIPQNNQVNVPLKCYFGDTASSPGDAIVCKGQSVQLNYIGGINDNCSSGTTFQWYNGKNPVLGANGSTLSVFEPGFYHLQLTSSSGCIYMTPTPIMPVFNVLPSTSIVGNTILCADPTLATVNTIVTGITDAPTFNWTLDGLLLSASNNDSTLELNNLGVGTHNVVLNAQSAAGCLSAYTLSILVANYPSQPTITVNYDCETHQFILNANASEVGTFLWSNGKSGATITEFDGGPFEVWFNNGSGCIASQSIFVPYSSEKYLWTFPSGCYRLCANNPGMILGPNNYFNSWNWILNNEDSLLNGVNSYVTPQPITVEGQYNLELNSGNGCIVKSDNMDVTFKECVECRFQEITQQSITPIFNGFCSYTVVISFINAMGYNIPTSLISSDNKFIISSPVFTAINGGVTSYTFNLIPINGFVSGVSPFIFNGKLRNGQDCNKAFELNFPTCTFSKTVNSKPNLFLVGKNNLLSLNPNPAKTFVDIAFESEFENNEIMVYDLQGRQIEFHSTIEAKGTWNLTINNFSAGIYVVVLKKDNQILAQQKLVVK